MSFSFGSTAAQPAASSGFSFSSTPAAAPTGGGFSFGGASTPAPAASGGGGGGFSFGSSTGSGSAAAPAGSSSGFNFGGSTGGATSTAARSLFGSTPGSAGAAPAAGTGGSGGFSFGGSSTGTAAPATGGSSLFGGATTGGSSLFGGGAGAANTGTTGSTGGFFGSSGATATGGSSFFGAPAAGNTNTSGSSLFGASSAAPTGTGSFGFFGGAGGAPQQNGQGITLETSFESLPADVKKNIVEFHQFLKGEDQSDAFLKTVSPRKLDDLSGNIQRLEQDVLVRRNVQDRQATAVHHLRKDVKNLIHQVDNATLSMRTLDGNSASNLYNIMRHVETPSPYYWELLDHFESKMEAIKTQIEDIESEYKPLYDRRAQGSPQQQHAAVSPALLHQILVAQNASLMQVAARVAEVHERAEVMRQHFLIKMRQDLERHGEHNPAAFKNPFDKRKKSANEDKRETIDKIRFRTSVAPTIVSAPAAPQQQQQQQTGGFGGFSGFGAAAPAATTATSSLFGSAPAAASAFGSTAPATTATTGSLFGGTSSFSSAAPAATTGGSFGFGSTTTATAPKQVSFSLGSTAPAATAVPASTSFTIPSVSTGVAAGGFGSVSSTFLPGGGEAEKRAASNKRLSGRPKKRA